MRFSEWLLNESGGGSDAGSDFFYGLILYPSDAFDFGPASSDPPEHWYLQRRWRKEEQEGRKFHNIDNKEFQQRTYRAVYSRSMPDTKPGFWRNHADKAEGAIGVYDMTKPDLLGVGKSGARLNISLHLTIIQYLIST